MGRNSSCLLKSFGMLNTSIYSGLGETCLIRDDREDGRTGITAATAWANIILLKHKDHTQWVLFYLTDE